MYLTRHNQFPREIPLKSIIVFALLSTFAIAQSNTDQLWKKATAAMGNTSAQSLGNDKITAGLKEALTVSTGKAVAATGKPDGFFKNDTIKILMPEKLRTVEKGVRLMGGSKQIDDLVLGMNRAAEQAAPQAKQIFINAVTKMTIDDARSILSGNQTAATEYFKKQTSQELAAAFAPIIHKSMENVGVTKQYAKVMQQSPQLAFLNSDSFNLDKYIVGRSLDGLFFMLGEEEKKIRTNPAAQTTSLLKQVFGKKN
ncbi:MAG: hypothetical protein JWO20_2296 [Candidatus Angelobacter sp.]|nr:hypothetical protein [Candidatus Angelobacter sp.]